MSFLSSLIKKYASDILTVSNAQNFIHDRLTEVANFVAGTENQVDDAIFAELSVDVNFDTLTETTVNWVRNWFGLNGMRAGGSLLFASRPMHADGRRPGLFLSIVRGRMITEVMKQKHLTRAQARDLVNAKTDDQILSAAGSVGVPMMAIGDGTILNWLIAHGPDLLALIMKILPLLMLI